MIHLTPDYMALLRRYRLGDEKSNKLTDEIKVCLDRTEKSVVALENDIEAYKNKVSILEAENAKLRGALQEVSDSFFWYEDYVPAIEDYAIESVREALKRENNSEGESKSNKDHQEAT